MIEKITEIYNTVASNRQNTATETRRHGKIRIVCKKATTQCFVLGIWNRYTLEIPRAEYKTEPDSIKIGGSIRLLNTIYWNETLHMRYFFSERNKQTEKQRKESGDDSSK